ncbi:hypothetical protein F5887DRAFT_891923 [Amanita rubescens]|nr:hypothetical protein F5887DRAFT_891923 [Amanita rubescens]
MDNASTNNVLARTLSHWLISKFDIQFIPENGYIRCLAHVVNLVVQELLSKLGEVENPNTVDYYKTDQTAPLHYEAPDDEFCEEDGREVESDDAEENDEDREDSELMEMLGNEGSAMSAVKKLRVIVNKIVSSPQRRNRFRRTAQKKYKDTTVSAKSNVRIASLMVVRDVAIDMWVCDDENLRHLLLSNNEWNHLEKLAEVLKVFTQVTQVISSAGTPTLPWIIPMYELMQRHLSSKADMRSLPFEIQSACQEALGKLDKYYIIAVNCQYNILATLLHPHLGVMYFQKLGAERVRKAKIL